MTHRFDVTTPISIENLISGVFYDSRLLSYLESEEYEVITGERLASLRIQEGSESNVYKRHQLVREAALFLPGEKPRVIRSPPYLESISKLKSAMETNKLKFLKDNGGNYIRSLPFRVGEIIPTEEEISAALPGSAMFPHKKIPTDRFGDEEITTWLFGGGDSKKAREYGEFLKSNGAGHAWSASILGSEEMPYIRPLSVDGVNSLCGSDIVGNQLLHRGGFRIIAKDYSFEQAVA